MFPPIFLSNFSVTLNHSGQLFTSLCPSFFLRNQQPDVTRKFQDALLTALQSKDRIHPPFISSLGTLVHGALAFDSKGELLPFAQEHHEDTQERYEMKEPVWPIGTETRLLLVLSKVLLYASEKPPGRLLVRLRTLQQNGFHTQVVSELGVGLVVFYCVQKFAFERKRSARYRQTKTSDQATCQHDL